MTSSPMQTARGMTRLPFPPTTRASVRSTSSMSSPSSASAPSSSRRPPRTPPPGLPSSRSATSTRPSWTRRRSRPMVSRPFRPICSASPRPTRARNSRTSSGSRDSLRCSTCSCRPISRTPTATVSLSANRRSAFPTATITSRTIRSSRSCAPSTLPTSRRCSPSPRRRASPPALYTRKRAPQHKELRAKYVAYIAQLLTLGGASDAAAQARDIMAFETAAAKVQWPIEKRRDVEAIYNPRSKQQLLAFAPAFPWQAFLEAQQLGARQELVLAEYSAIHDLAELFNHTAVTTLKAFLTFHYLSSHAQYLPKRFDEARFAFYGQTMRGQPQQRERWKRGVDSVDGALGESVGRLYVVQYFPPDSKAKMQQLVTDLRAALSQRIDALDWMTPPTKSRAHEKLAMFTPKIGYPEKWKDYSALLIRRDDLLGNVRRATEWDWNYQVARLDKPVDRAEWQMT